MATLTPNAVPDNVNEAIGRLANELRDRITHRAVRRCAIGGCIEPPLFVCLTLLAPIARPSVGVNWSAICLRHASEFSVATGTQRP